MTARIRETGAQRYEVEIWALDNAVAVIDAAPAANGSTLTVWLHPKVLEPVAAELMARVKSC